MAAGHRKLAVRLVERGLNRGALLERLHRLLLRGPGLALKLHHPPVGRGDALDVPAVFLAALLQIRALRLHVALQLGDLGAACGELGELLGFGLFVSGDGLLRRGQDVPQAQRFRFKGPGLLLGVGQVFAQLVLRYPCGVQHVLQAELFVLGFLVGAQRLADRIDQLADRVLDELELADLVLGVDQKIADGFILVAKLRRGRKE